jgi:hypothetical protein
MSNNNLQKEAHQMKPFDWQRVWRGAGIQFLGLFVVAALVRGELPKVGASTDALIAFYDGDRTRILIATVIFGFALLNLMWFGAAIASALRDAGMGGWGNAATAASTAFAGVWFVIVTIGATLAYSVAGSGNNLLTSGLNDLTWALLVVSAFPTAMVIMSGSFGLWRAGILSSRGFALGVTAMVLVLLQATAWASDGFWAPDGAYSQYVAPTVVAVWVLGISRVLLSRKPTPAAAKAVDRVAVPAR